MDWIKLKAQAKLVALGILIGGLVLAGFYLLGSEPQKETKIGVDANCTVSSDSNIVYTKLSKCLEGYVAEDMNKTCTELGKPFFPADQNAEAILVDYPQFPEGKYICQYADQNRLSVICAECVKSEEGYRCKTQGGG